MGAGKGHTKIFIQTYKFTTDFVGDIKRFEGKRVKFMTPVAECKKYLSEY